MWHLAKIIVVLYMGVVEISSATIPAYIKPCSKTKDFKKCAIKDAKEALPFLLKGDPKFKIPNLLPLKLPLVDVESGPNLKIKLTDIEVFGLDTVTLTDMDIDFSKLTAYLELNAKHLSIISTYDIDGKIMVLPIQGHGPFNLTAVDCKFKYIFSLKLENRGGNNYAIVQDDDKLEYHIGNAHFALDNLFNGNRAMGDNVNKFLNDNVQDVIKELGGAIEGTISAIARRVGGGILSNIPFDALFLP